MIDKWCGEFFGVSKYKKELRAEDMCASQRPSRNTFCQLPKGHKGECRAVVYWEGGR